MLDHAGAWREARSPGGPVNQAVTGRTLLPVTPRHRRRQLARQLLEAPGVSRTVTQSRGPQRGVTLVEVGLGAAALAVAAGTVLWLVGPRTKSDEYLVALRHADAIREATLAWERETDSGCPTLTQLQRDGHLKRNAETEDPWGGRYRLICTDGGITIRAPGPDHRLDTPDDVRVAVE